MQHLDDVLGFPHAGGLEMEAVGHWCGAPEETDRLRPDLSSGGRREDGSFQLLWREDPSNLSRRTGRGMLHGACYRQNGLGQRGSAGGREHH